MLTPILERKASEIRRRHRHPVLDASGSRVRGLGAEHAQRLRRAPGEPLRFIAEIKFRSPSAGSIREKEVGSVARLAIEYERAGAAAVSVLADGPGFGGSPLDVRRAARATELPILFKEFVLDEAQLHLARAVGASLVLLLVRALEPDRLAELVRRARGVGLEPVVEAADATELRVALDTEATVIGVNARDLRSFRVDRRAALELVTAIPSSRIAVLMSGLSEPEHVRTAARSRADAVLVGEALMRAEQPGARLRELLVVGNPAS
jgi:indole-3-glycerol phosphate synthase